MNFYSPVPVGIIAAVYLFLYVTDLEGSAEVKKVDYIGIIFLVIGIGSLEFVPEEGVFTIGLTIPLFLFFPSSQA